MEELSMTVKEFDDLLKKEGLTKSEIQDLDFKISRNITYREAEAYPGTLHDKAAAYYERYQKLLIETDKEHYLDNAQKMFDRYVGTQSKNRGTVAGKLIKQMGEFRYDFSFMDEVAAAEYLSMIYNRSENSEMSNKFAKYYDSLIEQIWKHSEVILFKYIFMQEVNDTEDMVAIYHYNSNRPNGCGDFIMQCEVSEFYPHDLSQAPNVIFELGNKDAAKPIEREVGLQMLSGNTNIDDILKALKA
jgi:hypothetical protein